MPTKKRSSKNHITLTYACLGSFEYAREHKSKGIFYYVDWKTGEIRFLDNVIKNMYLTFPDRDSFIEYVNKEYV